MRPPHMLRGCLWLVLATSFVWLRSSEAKSTRCIVPSTSTSLPAPPKFAMKIKRTIIYQWVGDSIMLDCSATGYPKPVVKWTKYGKPFTSGSTGSIYLRMAKPSDTGIYTCNVSNVYGWCNRTYIVQVMGTTNPFIQPTKNVMAKEGHNVTITSPPKIVTKLKRTLIAVPVGNSIKLDCSATGYPRPVVKWTKNGKPFTSRSAGPIYMSAYDFALALKDVVPSDRGLYTCNVSNVYGWFNRTYRVDVKEGIRATPFIEPIANATAKEGQNVTIACNAINDTLLDFKWLRWRPPLIDIIRQTPNKYNIIVQKKKFAFTMNLTLINVTKESEGKYSCAIANSIGLNTVDVYLKIITDAGTTGTVPSTSTSLSAPPKIVTKSQSKLLSLIDWHSRASPTKITSLGAPPKLAIKISHENNGSFERPFSVDVAEPLQDHTASDKE